MKKEKKQKEKGKKISLTKIEKRMRHKTNKELIDLIIKLKKINPIIAKELSKPRRKKIEINLNEIDKEKGDVIIPGKVLSVGNITKAKKIVAFSASKRAIEKIKEAKGTFVGISDEIKKNPKLEKLTILR